MGRGEGVDEMKDFFLIEVLFTHVNNKPIVDFPYLQITPDIRIYYSVNSYEDRPDLDKCGFYFMVLHQNGIRGDENSNFEPWLPETSMIEIIYHGIAYFDGIRHFYMGHEKTDNEGYLYYPDIADHVKVMQELEILQSKYCRD